MHSLFFLCKNRIDDFRCKGIFFHLIDEIRKFFLIFRIFQQCRKDIVIIGTLCGLLKIHYDQIRKTADPVKIE